MVRDFTHLSPFEHQIWCWAGLEQLRAPGHIPTPTVRGILLTMTLPVTRWCVSSAPRGPW